MEGVGDSSSTAVQGEGGKSPSRERESNTDGDFVTGNNHSSPSTALKASSPPPFTAKAPVQPDPGNQLVAVKSELSSIRPPYYLPVVGSLPGRTAETKPHGSGKTYRGDCSGGGGVGTFDVPRPPSSTVVDERTVLQLATTNTVAMPSESVVDAATSNESEMVVKTSSGPSETSAASVTTVTKCIAAETVGVIGKEGEYSGYTDALSNGAPAVERKMSAQPASVAANGDTRAGASATVGTVSTVERTMKKASNSEPVVGANDAGWWDPPVLAATSVPSTSIDATSRSHPADAKPVRIATPQGPTPNLTYRAGVAGVVQGGHNAQSCAATSTGELSAVVRQSVCGVVVGEGQEGGSSADVSIAGGQRHSAGTQICNVPRRQGQVATATAPGIPESSRSWTLDSALGFGHSVGFVVRGQDQPHRSAGGTLSPTQQPTNPLSGSSGGVDGTSVEVGEEMQATPAVATTTDVGPASVEELESQEMNPAGRVGGGVVAEPVSVAMGTQPGSIEELLSPAADLGGQIGEEEVAGSVSDIGTSVCSAPQPLPELSATRNFPGEDIDRDSGAASVTGVATCPPPSARGAADTADPGAVAFSIVAPPGQGSTGRGDYRPDTSGGMDVSAITGTESETGSMKLSRSVEPGESTLSQDTMGTGRSVCYALGRTGCEQEPATNTLSLGGYLSGEPDTFDTMDIARAALLYANAAAAATTSPVIGSSNGPTAAIGQTTLNEDGQSFFASTTSPVIGSANGSTAAVGQTSLSEDGQSFSNTFASSSMSSLGEAPQALEIPPSASAALAAASTDAGIVRDAFCQPLLPSGASRVSTTSRKRSKSLSSRAKKHRDMMHIMCMICLEKLSDTAEGGGAKLLGLLDSCTHRYCYTCILEWSKVTNKCPQCKSRFHTIKAVKELRRNNDRYRGLAVSVEDRDQTYNFVDVRDVAVLDPDVGCHSDCLLRGAIDAFQRGWEFSVQCERCSNWFHGVCVGFHEEQAVPDLWFCRSCGGQAHQTVHRPGAATTVVTSTTEAVAPALDTRGGRASAVRGRVRGRGQTGVQSRTDGQDHLAPPIPWPGRDGGRFARGRGQAQAPARHDDVGDAEPNDGTCDLSRIARGGRRAGSAEAAVAATPAPSPMLLSPSLSSQSPSTAAVAAVSARGRTRRSRTPPLPSSLPPVQPPPPRVTRSSASPPSAPPSLPPLPLEQQEKQDEPVVEQSPRDDVTRREVQLNSSVAGGESCGREHAGVILGAPPPTSARSAASDSAGDGHHGLPQPHAQSLRGALEVSEATDLCNICGFDTETDNLIVYCESCNMGVHQTCYGISEIPKKEWYCSPCSNGVRQSTLACKFCPVKGGALKRCTDGEWGHILCAFWIPECCFMNPRDMEPIGSINKRGQAGPVELYLPAFRVRKCYICGTSDGYTIRCHTTSCRFHLHPMCGSKAGNVYMEIETSMKRDADGKEYETVKLVARCPKHNKNNTIAGRNRKTRAASPSAADPLRVLGKLIEIADPARDGADVLEAKVTWFDPVRSKYCVIETMHDRSEGGGGGSIGGGDAKGWAHWIAVDKLVEVKAIGIERNGTKFALESLLSLEEGEEDGGIIEQNESEMTTAESDAQDNVRVKMEEEEEDAGRKGGEESVASLSIEDGDYRKEETEQVDSTEGQKGRGEDVYLEENPATEKDDSRMRTRRTTIPPAAQEPDRFLQRDPEEEVGRATSHWPPARDTPLKELDGAFPVGQKNGPVGSKDSDTATASIENARNTATTKRAAEQNHRADMLLPSVQCPEAPDPSARYPTRWGRRRRAPSPALDHKSSITLEGASLLTKKPRLKDKGVAGSDEARTTVSQPTSTLPSPGGGDIIGGGDALSAVAVSAPIDVIEGASLPHQSPQETPLPVGGESGTGSVVSSGSFVEPITKRATELAYGLEAGWPYGMEMLGQVPVMRVRSVPISEGDEIGYRATYLASAYAGATTEVSSSDKRSVQSRFSFRFEAIEALDTSHLLRLGALQRESRSAEYCETPLQSCAGELGRAHQRERVEDDAKGHAYMDGGIHDSERSGAPDKQKEGGGIEPAGEKENGVILAQDSMPPSPCSSEEFSDSMEDGEMKTLPDGRADIMPPSPRDEDMEEDVAWGKGDQVAEGATENNVTVDPDHWPQNALNGDDGQENAADAAEDMEISSDDQSFGSPEGADTASSCASDEEVMCDVGADLAHSDAAATAATALDATATSARRVDEAAVATPSPVAAANCPLQQQQTPAGDSDNSQSSSAIATPQLLCARADQNEVATQREVVSSEPPPPAPVPMGERPEVLALRRIVREQLQDILRSATKGGEEALSGGDGNAVLNKIATDVEEELFGRLYKDSSGGRPYKAKYKQLLLSLGNVRNYRLVASVVAGTTTPADLATKDAVGLLNSLTSNLNCLAMPLPGRHKPGSAGQRGGNAGKLKRRGKMMLL